MKKCEYQEKVPFPTGLLDVICGNAVRCTDTDTDVEFVQGPTGGNSDVNGTALTCKWSSGSVPLEKVKNRAGHRQPCTSPCCASDSSLAVFHRLENGHKTLHFVKFCPAFHPAATHRTLIASVQPKRAPNRPVTVNVFLTSYNLANGEITNQGFFYSLGEKNRESGRLYCVSFMRVSSSDHAGGSGNSRNCAGMRGYFPRCTNTCQWYFAKKKMSNSCFRCVTETRQQLRFLLSSIANVKALTLWLLQRLKQPECVQKHQVMFLDSLSVFMAAWAAFRRALVTVHFDEGLRNVSTPSCSTYELFTEVLARRWVTLDRTTLTSALTVYRHKESYINRTWLNPRLSYVTYLKPTQAILRWQWKTDFCSVCGCGFRARAGLLFRLAHTSYFDISIHQWQMKSVVILAGPLMPSIYTQPTAALIWGQLNSFF